MKLGVSLGGLAAMQLVSSLLLQIAILGILGAGEETDAWVAAQAVPLVVFAVLSVALQGAWQSRLAVAAHDRAQWSTLQRTAQGQLLLTFGIVTAALVATAFIWVPWVFIGMGAHRSTLTVEMTQLLLVAALLNGQSALLTTALRARGDFIAPEATALAGSIGTIVLAVLTVPHFGIIAAAWASLLRSALVSMILFHRAGRPVPSLPAAWHDSQGWRQARPILVGSSFYKTGPLVDRFWSSLAPAGGMTLFNFVQMGMGAMASVLERALCMPVVPTLARSAEACDWIGMRATYRRSIVRVGLSSLAILIALLALRPVWPMIATPVLKLRADALLQSWWLCVLLVGYLFPAAAGSVVVSSFYALGDTRTPTRIGIAGFCLSLALKAGGFLWIGLVGLALATMAHYLGNMLAMLWILERRIGRLISAPATEQA